MKFLSLVLVAILSPLLCLANVTSQVTKSGPFAITGSPQVIPTGFPFQQASDLLVLDYGTSAVTHDPALVLVLNSDYTVTGGGYNSANAMQQGSISVVSTGTNHVATGDNIVIMRNSPLNQTNSFTAAGPLTIQLIEQMGDKLATLSQQVNELGSRSLHFENFETQSGLLSRTARASKTLGFDENGNIAYSAGGGGSGTTYTAGTGLLLASNQFSVNPVQSLTNLTVTAPIVGSLAGNSSTATALQTPRNINGVPFDGSADITVTAAAGTLTGNTLNSTVTAAPGLLSASVGTFGNMAIQNKASVQITGGTITGMPSPTNASDVATKAYADSLATGIVQRAGVQVASTANIASLSGEQTIDGVLTSSSRILVKNQTLTQNNGIYVTAAGAWSRAADSNTAAQLKVGYYYFVSSGTTQGATGWTIQTAPTTLGVDPVVFGQFSASTSYSAGTGLSLAGNVFSLNSGQSGLTISGSTISGTPISGSTGSFTTLAASSLISSTIASGKAFGAGSATTGNIFAQLNNSGGNLFFGVESSAGSSIISGAPAYDTSISAANGISFSATNTVSTQMRLNSSALTSNVPYAINSNTNLRTTKTNFHVTINVKDYGAVGDGVTNDVAAINSAVAALTNNSALYFPPGNYLCSSAGITAISSVSNVTIYGEGAKITNSSGINNNTLVINPTCDSITIRDLAFKHTAASRGSGGAIRLYSDNSLISNCLIDGAGEFGVLISNESGGTNDNSSIDNCTIENTQGDGLHIGQVSNIRATNLIISNTGDDAIGIVDDLNQNQTNRILVANANIYNAGTLGSSGCGVRIAEATDVQLSNVQVYNSLEAGCYVTRASSTSDYNSRIVIQNSTFTNCCSLVGPRGAIWLEWCNDSVVRNCYTYNNSNGYGISLLDCNDLLVNSCNVKTSPSRGIGTDDTTTTNVAATWTRWTITNNTVDSNTANEAFYFVPASTKTLANLLVLENHATNVPSGNYIFTNRLGTASKVGNNTSLEARSVANGGSGTAPTTFNNN